MKKLILTLMIVLMVFSVISCSEDKKDAPAGMKEVTNGSAKYQLFVPEEWDVDRNDGAISVHVSSKDFSNFSVTTFEFPYEEYGTLEEYFNGYVADKYINEELKTNFPSVSDNIEITTCEVDGREARSIVFTATVGKNEHKYKQIITVSKDAYVYIFTYTSSVSGFDRHLADIDRIISEFNFL